LMVAGVVIDLFGKLFTFCSLLRTLVF
jgi:hypothetical protein